MHFAAEVQPVRPADQRARILIVEPNRRYLAVLARRLHEQGYRVVTAESTEGALAELYRVSADLILCESRLRGGSGFNLIRLIRGDAALKQIPFLLIVGRSDSAAAVKGLEAGADGVTRKPCHFEVLGACIAREIERAKTLRQVLDANAALDARVVCRTVEASEIRARYEVAEAELQRLQTLVGSSA
jgi:DNA-binding response OmpR family regulator